MIPAQHLHKVVDIEYPEQLPNHIHHYVGEQLTQGFNISGCSGNRPPDWSFVKKLNVQRLDLLKHSIPHTVKNPLPKPAGDVGIHDQDDELPDQSQNQEEDDPSQSVEISDRYVIIHSNLGQFWTHCSQKCCGQSQHIYKVGPTGI